MASDRDRTASTGRAARADLELIGKAARLHYDFGLTHQDISEILRISRVKVTRLLGRARETGVVQIQVLTDASPYAALEHELVGRYGLEEAVVVPGFDDDVRAREAVARGVATYLQRVLRDGMVVTIGFSRTLAVVPDFVVAPADTDATFVPLVGGLGRTSDAVNAHQSTERLAQLFGGRAEHLHAPAVIGSPEVAAALRDEPGIAHALACARSADLVLVGLGGMTTSSGTLLDGGAITHRELEALQAAGAVGDIAARFFDAEGAPVDVGLGARLIGLTLDEIASIPTRVVAAGGVGKLSALRAGLTARMATVLITDAPTAQAL